MQLHVINVDDIVIPKNRQRRLFDEHAIQELAASIMDNGLIHPLVIRAGEDNELVLVAGERRLRALEIAWGFGEEVRCGEKVIPERYVPCLYLGEIDPIDAFEVELEENVRRTDLDWKEKAIATRQLYDLRRLQAERAGEPPPSVTAIANEVKGVPLDTPATEHGSYDSVREDIILAGHLDNPDIAKAPSRKEAWKILKRSEERDRNARLGEAVGANFSSSMHTLLQGDCTTILPTLPSESFDVICTDPPYGIGADDFGDSAGKTAGAHRYDDSYESWLPLMTVLANESFRVAKPQAHLYVFCDIDRFASLRDSMAISGWKVFRTPLIWINPTAMRAPWPDRGPQRKWQAILYAVKGDKQCTKLYSDVITVSSDANFGHQAQKPVGVYVDLLRRSVRPGDTILDPFCGTGPVYPAAHEFKCKATGIELAASAAGIAARRIKELK